MVVVGAGPAGAATALRLAGAGRSVLLLERSRFTRPRVGETLAPEVQPLLRELGVWEGFRGTGPLPSWGTRSVWDDPEPVDRSHLSSGYGSGWHVDRLAVDRMLATAAGAAGADVRTGTAVVEVGRAAAGWEVRGAGGQRWAGRVLVDATGRRAGVGRRLDGQRLAFDRMVAVAAEWAGVDPAREGYLLVEAAAEGWWYTAPLPGGRLVGMVMTDADLCRRDGLRDGLRWWRRLRGAGATAARVAAARGATAGADPRGVSGILAEPCVHPAASHRLRRSDDPRPWLAVGDAGLAVDPASGSGVLRALRSAADAAQVVELLLDAPAAGGPAVARYEFRRDRECTEYLRERARYYAGVRRFRTPFWARRRAAVDRPASRE